VASLLVITAATIHRVWRASGRDCVDASTPNLEEGRNLERTRGKIAVIS
jgi:hypothetical protein